MGHGVAWLAGGTAGEGLESGGDSFAQALAACGYAPTTQRDFPSRIRGGDTTFTVRLTPEGELAPPSHIDLALAFNATVLPRIDAKLGPDSLLLVDAAVPPFVSAKGARVESVPFTKIAEEVGMAKAKNVVALGVSTALLGLPVQEVADAVANRFASKGPEVVAMNKAALLAGHEAAVERFDGVLFQAPAPVEGPALLLTGNQAAALGALAAGCRVAAAYPITPASDILEYLTPRLAELGGVALQMEDEMAALNLCIGAGFTGAKALTATSGPGLSLMTETMGLAGATETPVVVVDCQRPGPSTGMPTKHGQDDLWHLAMGGHGEDVRLVLAPIDVADAFRVTSEAFRLAEAFRCPAFVALDQQASLFKQTVPPFDMEAEAARHGERADHEPLGSAWEGAFQPYGDAPRLPLPGEQGSLWFSNSTEHGPSGFTNEDPKVRDAMVERRLARMEAIREACEDPILTTGADDADVILLSWGSTVGACREAATRLALDGVDAKVVAVRLVWPLPEAALKDALAGDAPVLCAEANAFGQLGHMVKAALPIHDRFHPVLRYDGTPVLSDDLLSAWEAIQ